MIPGTDTTTGQQVALLTRIDPVIGLSRSSSRAAYPIVGSTCGIGRSFSKGQLRSGHAGLSKHYLAQFEISLTLQEKRHGGGGSKLRKIAAAKEGSKSVFYQAKSRLKSSILSSTPTPSMPQDSFSFTLLLAGAHFLAQSDNADRCLRREAQATVLTRLLQGAIDRLTARRGRHRPIEIIVTGDFNDHDSEAVGADGEQPLSSTLQVLKRVAGYRLRTAASWIRDQADRYSSWHDRNRNCLDDGKPEHSLIDHVLLSEGLHGRLRSVWMDHNATVSCRDRVSDHFPIILDIA